MVEKKTKIYAKELAPRKDVALVDRRILFTREKGEKGKKIDLKDLLLVLNKTI